MLNIMLAKFANAYSLSPELRTMGPNLELEDEIRWMGAPESCSSTYLSSVTDGNPDLFKYAQSSAFTVGYLGCLTNVEGLRGQAEGGGADSHTDILEIIDRAQVSVCYCLVIHSIGAGGNAMP